MTTRTAATTPPANSKQLSARAVSLRVAAAATAVVGAAIAVLTPGGGGVTGFDTTYAIVWARDLMAGQGLARPPSAPTAHPLGLVVGTIVAPAGDFARTAAAILAAVALAMSCGLMAVIAAKLAGLERRSAIVVGAPVAMLMLARPEAVYLARFGSLDWVYTALVLGAVAFSLHNRRDAGMSLAGIAGLHRPEAWLLAGALAWVSLRSNSSSGDKESRLRLMLLACGLGAVPAAWLILGVLLGNPLAAMQMSQANAADFGRSTGAWHAPVAVPSAVATLIGWPGLLAGAVSVVWLVVKGLHTVAVRQFMMAVAVALLGPVLAAAGGGAVLPRYQLALSALLAAAAIALIIRLVLTVPGRLVAIGLALAIVVSTAMATPRFQDMTRVEDEQRQIEQSLTAILTSTRDACQPIWTPAHGTIPVIALDLDLPLHDLRDLPPQPPSTGTVIHPLTPADVAAAGFAPPQRSDLAMRIPPTFALVADSQHWAIYTSC